METRSASRLSHSSDALDWNGRSRSARLARVNKPLRCRPLEGRRDQKSPLRRCFRPRPPLRAGCAGFASGCQSSVRSYDRGDPRRYWVLAISLRAAVRPLVRMPTDRHTATGTCEIGRTAINLCCDPLQEISLIRMKNLARWFARSRMWRRREHSTNRYRQRCSGVRAISAPSTTGRRVPRARGPGDHLIAATERF
jgi:hypothetical protein